MARALIPRTKMSSKSEGKGINNERECGTKCVTFSESRSVTWVESLRASLVQLAWPPDYSLLAALLPDHKVDSQGKEVEPHPHEEEDPPHPVPLFEVISVPSDRQHYSIA